MSTEESLPPNFPRLDAALRSIGYSFEAAVADVIDNSIDAEACNVLVRLFTRTDGHLDLAIWDDGKGMDSAGLKEAMRFGSNISAEIARLGKFGLGLKLASLSQAREVRVVTAKSGRFSGRAWLEHGIAKGFSCTVFDESECKQLVSAVVPDRMFRPSGTVVWWSHLYRIGQHHGRPEERAQKLMRRLEAYLALSFHRFLSGRSRRGKVRITLDIFDQDAHRAGIPIDLDPLDPFGYSNSGRDGFPAIMHLEGHYKDRMSIKAHIWPANSLAPGYRLPGGANSRQGFYFYRNDRLIQGGGWNGTREAEPHSSLARVEIDLAGDFDVEVSLDVKKVEIQLPPDLAALIQSARSASGIDYRKYLSLADETYRKRRVTDAELPLIPSFGLPAKLAKFMHGELRIKGTTRHRDLKIKWKALAEDEFFALDRDSGSLYLNQLYRRQLLHGRRAASGDIPLVKCLLFLVLEDALSSERMGPRVRQRTEQANRILVKAVAFEGPAA